MGNLYLCKKKNSTFTNMELHIITFSPTGTSRKVALGIASGIEAESTHITDLTHRPGNKLNLGQDQLLLVSLPVYGGHIAPTAMERMKEVYGNGTMAIAVAVYGNRHYEHALKEISDLLSEHGFNVIACGTFIGEHSYSTAQTPIAVGRPDNMDIDCAKKFGKAIAQKLSNSHSPATVDAKSIALPKQDAEVMMHFKQTVMGWMKEGIKMPASPLVDMSLCNECGTCVVLCPTEAITKNAPTMADSQKCIKCCACVKGCPSNARTLTTPFAELLAKNFTERKENMTLL